MPARSLSQVIQAHPSPTTLPNLPPSDLSTQDITRNCKSPSNFRLILDGWISDLTTEESGLSVLVVIWDGLVRLITIKLCRCWRRRGAWRDSLHNLLHSWTLFYRIRHFNSLISFVLFVSMFWYLFRQLYPIDIYFGLLIWIDDAERLNGQKYPFCDLLPFPAVTLILSDLWLYQD